MFSKALNISDGMKLRFLISSITPKAFINIFSLGNIWFTESIFFIISLGALCIIL